jgi:PAS domain S-box-containing protein
MDSPPDDRDKLSQLISVANALTRDKWEESSGDQLVSLLSSLIDIIDDLPLVLFIKDTKEFRFRLWNKTAEEKIGLLRGDLIGRFDSDFFPKAEIASFREKDQQTFQEKRLIATEEPISTPHGRRWLYTKKIPLCDREGQVRYVLGVSEDITDSKRAMEDQERQYQQVAQALELRDKMLSAVAHDLKTPLTVISLSSASLLRSLPSGERDKPIRRQVERVADTAHRMGRLVNDLLGLSKIEAGRLSLDKHPHHAADLLAEVAEAMQPLVAQRGLTLAVEVDDLAPLPCDKERILQALTNLADNAIKFTPSGGKILLAARAAREGVRFSVSDTGPGIAADLLPRIFMPYQQAEKDRKQGSGLGLAIAKGMVEAHGGTIGVESRPGRGSTFFFNLPR